MTTPAARRIAALTAEAAAVVAKLIDGIGATTAADAVSEAARTSAALLAMIGHLREHPDALRSGSSEGPNAIIKLAQALHGRGIDDVVLPGCAVCGRVVREMRRVEGKGVCQVCYLDSRRRACSQCGTVARIVSSKGGRSICNACHLRDPERHEACAGCGKPRRVAHRDFRQLVVLRRARQRARRRPTTEATASWARQRIRAAAELLIYLEDHGSDLPSLDQRGLDQWLAAGRSTRYSVRDFVRWAARQGLTRPLTVPLRQAISPEQSLSHDDRWRQLRRCIRDPELPVRLRVAGALILLYGHPGSRIVAMRTSQIEQQADGVYLAIGEHRTLLPPVIAELVIELRDTAPPASIFGSSRGSADWLFPGLVPGQHMADNYLVKQLNAVGIRIRTARNSALISLAADLPAPILADLLGLHINTAVRWVRRSKRDWATYIEARAEAVERQDHSDRSRYRIETS